MEKIEINKEMNIILIFARNMDMKTITIISLNVINAKKGIF